MNNDEDEQDVIEIRVFLRIKNKEDKDIFGMFKQLKEELKPIRYAEIGKHVLQKAYDHWFKKRKEKGN